MLTKTKDLPAELLYDEKVLLLRIAEGDESAFSKLFYRAVPSLQAALKRFTKTDTDTEEIIQETFIRVWLNREKLPEVENILGYLYRIAVNAFLTRLRKETAECMRHQKWGNAHRNEIDWSCGQTIELRDVKKVVDQAVHNLPLQRRKIYLLSRDEGMPMAEIANSLGISVSTVKNTMRIALCSIRQQLLEVGYPVGIAGILLNINIF